MLAEAAAGTLEEFLPLLCSTNVECFVLEEYVAFSFLSTSAKAADDVKVFGNGANTGGGGILLANIVPPCGGADVWTNAVPCRDEGLFFRALVLPLLDLTVSCLALVLALNLDIFASSVLRFLFSA